MPMKRELYAPDWEETSKRVREEANQRCEWCGKPNGKIVSVGPDGVWWASLPLTGWSGWVGADGKMMPSEFDPPDNKIRRIRVVLTVAHLDQSTRNDERSNLAALCQRCHLKHDGKANAAKAQITREQRAAIKKHLVEREEFHGRAWDAWVLACDRRWRIGDGTAFDDGPLCHGCQWDEVVLRDLGPGERRLSRHPDAWRSDVPLAVAPEWPRPRGVWDTADA